MNMFKKTKATTIPKYLAQLPEERKEFVVTLHEFIQKTVPLLKPHFANNMIGYGSFPYTNYKKEELEWPVVALANQKNYVSVYICAVLDGEYIAEKYADALGKVSVGKSCIRIKKLEDVSLPTLKICLELAAKHPGLVTSGKHK